MKWVLLMDIYEELSNDELDALRFQISRFCPRCGKKTFEPDLCPECLYNGEEIGNSVFKP